MTYRFEITADTLTELAGKALALAAQLNATAAPAEAAPAIPAADAAPAARRKPKAAPAPAPEPVEEIVQPEPVETAEEVVQPDPEPAPVEEIEVVEAEVVEAEVVEPAAAVESAISYEKDIMPGVVEVVTKRGKPVMAEILAQFGAAKASHIDPDQYPELLAAIRDALASAA